MATSRVHTLYHTFARAMQDAGANVGEIQARLGHASLATTGRYLAALGRARIVTLRNWPACLDSMTMRERFHTTPAANVGV